LQHTMETQLWAIAVKGDQSVSEIKKVCEELAEVSPFNVPASALRVGTLDNLMSLSDDLTKMETMADATVTKMYKQLMDLKDRVGIKDDEATIGGVPVTTYTTRQWEWDQAKLSVKTPLRELCESISLRLTSLDDELKIKLTEVNALKSSISALERKLQGNLMVRGLSDIVQEHDCMESDYMTTVFVVVPKMSAKDFEGQYMTMAKYVVPLSAKLMEEDSEYALYRVIIFKKSSEEFKAMARERRLTLREFTYAPGVSAEEDMKKREDTATLERLKGMLANWCSINYAESYTMMLHLKAVRIFVESVLRYGLTATYAQGMVPNFKSFILQPKKGKAEALRKALGGLFSSVGISAEGEDESAIPGAGGEFYPYVYTAIETAPNIA